MKFRLIYLFVALLFLNACVTAYQGSGPDFSLKGDAAKTEIEKFTISPSFFQHGTKVYEMGPEHTNYWQSSLEPVMSKVSPESMKLVHQAQKWYIADLAFLAIAVGILIGSTGSSSTSWQTPFDAALVLAVGSGIYSNVVVGEAADQYNSDLRRKFSPQLSVSIPY